MLKTVFYFFKGIASLRYRTYYSDILNSKNILFREDKLNTYKDNDEKRRADTIVQYFVL